MKILIVVESNAKAKKIQEFLKYQENQYICIASYGHIEDLKKSEMSIDFQNWTAIYEFTNQKAINNIKKLLKTVDVTYIASDPDNEGSQIANSISKILDKNMQRYRITFNEVTKSAILEAIENKHQIDYNKVNCQITRRLSDRLFGYKLSPLLWNYFNINTLSAGRVQSPVLACIVKNTNNVNNPNPEITYKIKGDFDNNLLNTLYEGNKEKIDNIVFNKPYNLTYNTTDSIQKPPPPYITSTLQMDCSYTFGLSSKQTMDILQKMYESGYITYHRTSSYSVSNQFKFQTAKYVLENYGEKYSNPNNYNFKQGAHECIRITNINKTSLTDDDIQNKIYKLVYKRSLASQLSYALYDQYNIELKYDKDIFKTIKKVLKFDGFLILDKKEISKETLKFPNKLKILKVYTEASVNKLTLYNDTTIIKLMENEGIGTPSTYATIVSSLFSKNYAEYCSNPKKQIKAKEYFKIKDGYTEEKEVELELYTKGNNKMIRNTEIGKEIVEYLNEVAPYIINPETTKIMEEQIELVAEGKVDYKKILDKFNKTIDESILNAPKRTIESEPKLIKTKYGKCILTPNKKYINYEGYLKQLDKKSLSKNDIAFLVKLPIKYKDDKDLVVGRYGIYLKDAKNNIALKPTELKDIITTHKLK
jgi:DNA topoisomerase-1